MGRQVEAGWDELWEVLPEAWNKPYRRKGEFPHRVDNVLLDVSPGRSKEGICPHSVGAQVEMIEDIPAGMMKKEIAAH